MLSKISPHFTLQEASKSQVAIRRGIDNTPPDFIIGRLQDTAYYVLEPVRVHFDIPFSPSSWYRSPFLNTVLHGAKNSQHVTGHAVDFEIPGVSNLEAAKWIIENLDFDQLILEFWNPKELNSGWVHVSYVAGKNRKEVLRYNGTNYMVGI